MAFLPKNSNTSLALQQPMDCGNVTIYYDIMGIAAVASTALNLPANAWIVWLLARGSREALNSNLSAFNKAIAEMIICPVVLIASLCSLNCKISLAAPALLFFSGIVTAGRPLLECLICMERYVAVVHPIIFLKYKTLKYRLALLALIWMIILVFCTTRVFFNSLSGLIIIIILVMAIESFCSLSILRVLKQPRPGDGQREMNTIKRKAFNTVLTIQLMMVFNYVPYIIVMALQNIISYWYYMCVVLPTASSLLVFAGSGHTILYLLRTSRLPCY